jgi:predicted transcriptional regulator
MKNLRPHKLVQGQADEADRLAALRQAAQEGIADIDAGRFKTFVTKQELRKHVQTIAAKAPTFIHQARYR